MIGSPSIKLGNNDLSIKPTEFELSEVCTESIAILQAKYPDRSIFFNGGTKTLYADKTMIELIVTNLIDNALKYSEEDVTIILEPHRLTIADKGIGIAPSELDKITLNFIGSKPLGQLDGTGALYRQLYPQTP